MFSQSEIIVFYNVVFSSLKVVPRVTGVTVTQVNISVIVF